MAGALVSSRVANLDAYNTHTGKRFSFFFLILLLLFVKKNDKRKTPKQKK